MGTRLVYFNLTSVNLNWAKLVHMTSMLNLAHNWLGNDLINICTDSVVYFHQIRYHGICKEILYSQVECHFLRSQLKHNLYLRYGIRALTFSPVVRSFRKLKCWKVGVVIPICIRISPWAPSRFSRTSDGSPHFTNFYLFLGIKDKYFNLKLSIFILLIHLSLFVSLQVQKFLQKLSFLLNQSLKKHVMKQICHPSLQGTWLRWLTTTRSHHCSVTWGVPNRRY
jgi:hypothetical protein